MRIAIVDDDKEARDFALEVLTGAGHACMGFNSGQAIVSQLKRETFDLLLLDWNMPDLTAIDVISWVRRNLSKVLRIIVLTSRNEEKDIVHALDAGADDFISKPASAEIIRARVMANLRRTRPSQAQERFQTWGVYRFDRLEQSVSVNGTPTALTPKEFALSLLLFENLQRPLSRTYLLQRLWNNTIDLSTRTLDMHISKIRTKLCLRPENGFRLQTLSGYGYRLDTYNGNSPETD